MELVTEVYAPFCQMYHIKKTQYKTRSNGQHVA